jgi:SAM-dependent methyltransferase
MTRPSAHASKRPVSRSKRFTFRGNLAETRHGWLRLTPAYSVELVRDLLAREPRKAVLDPFCGTGTTLLACAERGIDCDTLDVNPFLIWLARAKSRAYSERARSAARRTSQARDWVPPLFRIERWWNEPTLAALSRAKRSLSDQKSLDRAARDLAELAFCRTLITSAEVSFRHQSMSFKNADKSRNSATERREQAERVAGALETSFASLAQAIGATRLLPSTRRARLGDSRDVEQSLGDRRYDLVLTSPPYCNRMSYIRELRPYMYWLGFLGSGAAAGELDWQAIGGTWGSATSQLAHWSPGRESVPASVEKRARKIEQKSHILSQYVRRYFCDVARHLDNLVGCLERGARVYYVVGNSTFYDVVVPVERIYAELLEERGFVRARVETLRKRTSKSALYEYLVSAEFRG